MMVAQVRAFAGVVAVVWMACSGMAQAFEPLPSNVLLVVADDLGVDEVGRYGIQDDTASTPTLDSLADEGVLFRNAVANPTCSPSRSSLLTGRPAYKHGIGTAISIFGHVGLPLSETTLPEMLDLRTGGGYAHSMVGKWHVSTHRDDLRNAPGLHGYDWFTGSVANLGNETAFLTEEQSYFSWDKVDNGALYRSETYATTDTVDDAIARIEAMPEPWLLHVAFNAPHAPYHNPPAHLVNGPPAHTKRGKYQAMVEAVDTELGRLLAAMSPEQRSRTTVIFVSDNGTPSDIISGAVPEGQHKGTVYEGGVRIPLIVAGPDVALPGTESDALVHISDIFATLAELAEAPLNEAEHADLDSRSLVPYLHDPGMPSQRRVLATEKFKPAGLGGPKTVIIRAVRTSRYKLIQNLAAPDELYDMQGENHETINLLEGVPSPEVLDIAARLEAHAPFAMPER
jgi:arylsulfatase A-like enzyme